MCPEVISGESFRNRNSLSRDLTRSPAATGVRATQPFFRTRFTLIVSRFLPTPFGTLVTIQERPRFVSLLTSFTPLHDTMHVLAEGDLSDIAKMISASLGAFHLIASTTESIVREDIRGIGCVLYGGTKISSAISFA